MQEYPQAIWVGLQFFQVTVWLFLISPLLSISLGQSAIILRRFLSLLVRRVRPGHRHEGKALARLFVNPAVLQEALISKRPRKGLTETETEPLDYQWSLVLLLRIRHFAVTGAFLHIWLILVWKIVNISFLPLFWSQVCLFSGWSWCLQKAQGKHFLHKRRWYSLTSASACKPDW